MKRLLSWKTLLILVLLWSLVTRFWRLDYPREYVFDEVYHAFTAKMYALERYEAWVWWESPPESVAYEWTHPPLAKVIMSWGINLFGGPGELPKKVADPEIEQTKEQQEAEKVTTKILAANSFGWRFFGALFGVLCTFGIFLLASSLFQNRYVGVLSALIFSLDLLPLVQSRTAMNDIFTVTFLVFAFYFFSKRVPHQDLPHPMLHSQLRLDNWLLSGIFLGCAIASKWTSLFGLGIVAVYQLITVVCTVYLTAAKKQLLQQYLKQLGRSAVLGTVSFAVIPFSIYLLSYWQLFSLPIYDYKGNDLKSFLEQYEGKRSGHQTTIQQYQEDLQAASDDPAQLAKLLTDEQSTLGLLEREYAFFYTFYQRFPYQADRFFLWWGVQKQMWWYHTNLKAEHNYTSKWWTWPLMVRPVWFYVNYCNDQSKDPACLYELERWSASNLYADIYTMGNPILYWSFFPLLGYFFVRYLWKYRWWMSSLAPFLLYLTFSYQFVAERSETPVGLAEQFVKVFQEIFPSVLLFSMLLLVCLSLAALISYVQSHKTHDRRMVAEFIPLLFFLLCFCAFWLPWARSPRIMFYYHFFPPVTFMYPIVAFLLYKLWQRGKSMQIYVGLYLVAVFVSFVYFYPHVTAFLFPQFWREQYWWFKSWQ